MSAPSTVPAVLRAAADLIEPEGGATVAHDLVCTDEWRPIPSHAGLFEASADGRVRVATRRRRAPAGHILSARIGGRGYLFVRLGVNGQRRKFQVHRLVCEAFNGPPPFAGALCRHLNDDPLDNRPENLAWGTISQNVLDAIANNRRPRDAFAARSEARQ